MKVMLLHGWGGSDYPHWQAITASKIAADYGTVSFPLIQHPHFPHLNRWRREVKGYIEDFRPEILICHSLANTLWMHMCHDGEIDFGLDRLYMVSPPSRYTEHDMLKSFFPSPIPDSLHATEIHIVVSDDDPWIEVQEAEEMARKYDARLEILENAGHINEESGYGEWRWLEESLGLKNSISTKGVKCP